MSLILHSLTIPFLVLLVASWVELIISVSSTGNTRRLPIGYCPFFISDFGKFELEKYVMPFFHFGLWKILVEKLCNALFWVREFSVIVFFGVGSPSLIATALLLSHTQRNYVQAILLCAKLRWGASRFLRGQCQIVSSRVHNNKCQRTTSSLQWIYLSRLKLLFKFSHHLQVVLVSCFNKGNRKWL
jgi:hypothetical protein